MTHDIDNRRSLRFSDRTSPSTVDEAMRMIQQDATVEHVSVRIYEGAQLDLQIEPYVKSGGSIFSLIDYEGKEYVDGDDDVWEFHVSESVREEDYVGVKVTNTSGNYAYDWSVDVCLDRAGGARRALHAIKSLIPGVGN